MNQTSNGHEGPRLTEILEIIARFSAGDLAARGTLVGDESVLGGGNRFGADMRNL